MLSSVQSKVAEYSQSSAARLAPCRVQVHVSDGRSFVSASLLRLFLPCSQAEYWATRRKELKDVEAAAQERKKKYAGSGMQFTAQALANKQGSFKSQG